MKYKKKKEEREREREREKEKVREREREPWTYTNQNNSKSQLDYVFINKKWTNSTLNCEAYSSFAGVSSDHKIIQQKFRRGQRRNTPPQKKTGRTLHVNCDIVFTNPSARTGYDTRSIFKRSLTGLNSESSFS